MIGIGRGLGIKYVADGHVEGAMLIGGQTIIIENSTGGSSTVQRQVHWHSEVRIDSRCAPQKADKDSDLADDITIKNYDRGE
jgi:hypothetical protein